MNQNDINIIQNGFSKSGIARKHWLFHISSELFCVPTLIYSFKYNPHEAEDMIDCVSKLLF